MASPSTKTKKKPAPVDDGAPSSRYLILHIQHAASQLADAPEVDESYLSEIEVCLHVLRQRDYPQAELAEAKKKQKAESEERAKWDKVRKAVAAEEAEAAFEAVDAWLTEAAHG